MEGEDSLGWVVTFEFETKHFLPYYIRLRGGQLVSTQWLNG